MLRTLLKTLFERNRYRQLPHDDFILRLRCTVIGEGMLHPGNIYLMDHAVRHMPAGGCVLEIGSYAGLSANLLRYLMQKYHRTEDLFCCDAWVYEGYHDEKGMATKYMDGRSDVLRSDYMAHIKNAFIQSSKLLSARQLPKAVHLDSDAFFEAWELQKELTDVFGQSVKLGGSIALAYVDGNHAYDYAKRDVENAAKYLLPGGYLLLDDSAKHQHFGSAKLAQELRQNADFETVLANPHYLFKKRAR
jgi:hypothetical protein